MGEGVRYEIVRPLGRGGFGSVYHARVLHPDGGVAEVALKVASNDSANTALEVERLRDEARILELLDHRAIVRMKRLIQLAGRWTIVLEFVDGANLKQVLEVERFPAAAALEVVAEVADALHQAYETRHATGRRLRLLHRDIKPQNIVLTAQGQVKVLDFGIARASFDGRESVTLETRFGSFAYMAPERYDSVDGPPGDVYSLGCLLHELITGEVFGRTSVNRLRHEEQRRAALTLLEMSLSEREISAIDPEERTEHERDLVELCGLCLAFLPEDRPEAAQLAKRARELAAEIGGDGLAAWAARVVPEVPAPQLEAQGEAENSGALVVGDFLGEGGPQPLGDRVSLLEPGFVEARTAEEAFAMTEEPSQERVFAPSVGGEGGSGEPQSGDEPPSDPFAPDDPTTVPTGADLGVEAVDYWDAAAAATLFKVDDESFPVRPLSADAEPPTHQTPAMPREPHSNPRGMDEPTTHGQRAGASLPRFTGDLPAAPPAEPAPRNNLVIAAVIFLFVSALILGGLFASAR